MISRARWEKEGEEGGVMHVERTCSWVCTRNYSGAWLITPSRGPIIIRGKDAYDIHRACGSTTPRPQLQSGRWPNHVLVKGFPRFLSLWVGSILKVQLVPPTQACHTLRGKTEKNVSVYCGRAYHSYIYFTSPNKTGAYTLVPSCGCTHPSIQIRRWLWHQSGFTVSAELERHIMSPIYSLPRVPAPLICCGPGGLSFCRIHSECRSIVDWGRGAHHTLHCDVLWQGRSYCR